MSEKKPKKKSPKPIKSPKKKPAKKPEKKNVASKKQKTYVAIVLDKSGSMSGVAPETIKSFNDQIDTIKKESVGMDTRIILTTFNHDVVNTFFSAPVDTLQTLTHDIYVPDGWTAMYDAICKTIDKMEKELLDIQDPETAVLFTIITDGAENSSKTFTKNDVANRITRLRNTKRWTFNLIGANINLEKASDDLNIEKGNILKISSSKLGITKGMSVSTQSTGTYMSNRRMAKNADDLGMMSAQRLYSDDPDQICDVSDDAEKK